MITDGGEIHTGKSVGNRISVHSGQNSYVAKMPNSLADKSVQDMISLISRIIIIALIAITVILDVTYVRKGSF